jgi:hypothetical protein
MANIIGLKQHPMMTVKDPKSGKLVNVPVQMTNKQKNFLEKQFETHARYEKSLKRT